MRSENQRALDSAIATYERSFGTLLIQQQPSASSEGKGTPGTPGGGGGGGGAPDLLEHLEGTHAAALQAAMADFDQQVIA